MCGIAGYLSRTSANEPVGRVLLDMLTGLARRGPDSAGIACFRSDADGTNVAWVRLPLGGDPDASEATVRARLGGLAEIREVQRHGDLLRLQLWLDAPAGTISRALERAGEDFEVVSLGEHLELVKQVGAPGGLEATFGVAAMRGSHGIGHTRLSTESRVDLSHSQPFWAHGVADLATVHNGHITNYDRLRRIYEQKGVRFFSENDSEVIGVYLADQLERGRTLEQALANSLDDFDGAFTYLVATADAIGYARDPFAFKPLVVVETPGYVAIANEEIAIRHALGTAGVAHEPTGHVYKLWHVAPAANSAAVAATAVKAATAAA
jgi:glutamine phosphoribosylpyrophosphate amidotransferase